MTTRRGLLAALGAAALGATLGMGLALGSGRLVRLVAKSPSGMLTITSQAMVTPEHADAFRPFLESVLSKTEAELEQQQYNLMLYGTTHPSPYPQPSSAGVAQPSRQWFSIPVEVTR